MQNKFVINNHENNDNTIEYSYYTIIGKHSSLDDDNNPIVDNEDYALAKKKTINATKYRYFIKVGAYGKIYNPLGLYTEGTSNKFLSKSGKKQWEFKEVNSKAFDMYLNFLRTKNIAWLNNAERSL